VREGTWAFSFNADNPGGRDQALLSKDHNGFKDGGHLTIWIGSNGKLYARLQDKTDSYYLVHWEEPIEAGVDYQVAFSFDSDTMKLFLNGELVDAEDGIPGGMIGNMEDTLVGASSSQRRDDDDRAHNFFEGEITNIVALDRALTPLEGLLLANADNDPSALEYDFEASPSDSGDSTPTPAIEGSYGKDVMVGTGDDDHFMGGAGKDKRKGQAGDAVLAGGRGKDNTKGGGADGALCGRKGNGREGGARG